MHIVSIYIYLLFTKFLFIAFYLSICCVNDFFFDVIFDIYINIETYDFTDIGNYSGEYKNKFKKYICKIFLIGITGFILLGCFYTLIFILIPIIKFRILQCSRRREPRFSEISDRLEGSHVSLMQERLNSDIL